MRHLAVLAALLSGCATPARLLDPPHVDAARAATVVVDSRCAGVVAGARALWTAGHCLRGITVAYRVRGERRERIADLLVLHDARDLAELTTDRAFASVPVARWPRLGEPAYVVHHRCPGGWCVGHGSVVYVSHRWQQAALDWLPPFGSSGSGVWGRDGALLGVVTHVGVSTGRAYFGLVVQ